MLSARIVQRPARFDRVDRVKAVVGQPVLPGDDRFWILGDPLVVQVDGGERIEVPVGFTTDGAVGSRMGADVDRLGTVAGPAALGGGRPRLALFAARCLQVTRRRSLSGPAGVRRGQLVEAEADVCRRRHRRLVGLRCTASWSSCPAARCASSRRTYCPMAAAASPPSRCSQGGERCALQECTSLTWRGSRPDRGPMSCPPARTPRCTAPSPRSPTPPTAQPPTARSASPVNATVEGCPVPPDRRQRAQRCPLRDCDHSGDVDHSNCGARTVYRAHDEEELRA